MSLLFKPISLVLWVVSGVAARRLSQQIWTLLGDEELPDPADEGASFPRVVAAAALQGAVLGALRATLGRQGRRAFRAITGSWPGAKDRS